MSKCNSCIFHNTKGSNCFKGLSQIGIVLECKGYQILPDNKKTNIITLPPPKKETKKETKEEVKPIENYVYSSVDKDKLIYYSLF